MTRLNKKSLLANNQLSILGVLSAAEFIEEYWQKKPLLISSAWSKASDLIEAEDLLQMACAQECESRLVLGSINNKRQNQNTWQCEQGPFTKSRIKKLPKSHWTILVQAVDQWMPDVASLLKEFYFLPRWRLDDIMISLASDGGSVGPHFDYYDVFLLQASGRRSWKIGQCCDELTPLQENRDLKLLKTFECQQEHLLKAGDMLYLPAGLAHWGSAVGDDCITISIGFRAPSQRELVHVAMEQVANKLSENIRYRDTSEAIDSDPFCINPAAAKNIQVLWESINADKNKLLEKSLVQALGLQATEVRYPENIEPPVRKISEKALQTKFQKKQEILFVHHVASRFAYRAFINKVTAGERAELYVDGEMYETALAFAKGICHGKIRGVQIKNKEDKELLLFLINQGSLLLI